MTLGDMWQGKDTIQCEADTDNMFRMLCKLNLISEVTMSYIESITADLEDSFTNYRYISEEMEGKQ